ncbi:hypothetical protein TNCT_160551 [Trichonephila clavata]|uniref:Uncharacterized protein n=1 Tax=Trichonephila clavata TaxID=2740835 RepID=A0A8X6INF2_TRICU|nr:hypothetical protein TNCT_160551 [Trichonephila clavata]
MANSDGVEMSSLLFKSQLLFAYECMSSICVRHTINWIMSIPEGDPEFYFADCILEAILKTIDDAQNLIDDHYQRWFKMSGRTVDYNNFKQLLALTTYLTCNSPYSHENLIEFLAFVCDFAVKAYLVGVTQAPYYAVVCITYAFTAFKFDSYASDNFRNFCAYCKKGLLNLSLKSTASDIKTCIN